MDKVTWIWWWRESVGNSSGWERWANSRGCIRWWQCGDKVISLKEEKAASAALRHFLENKCASGEAMKEVSSELSRMTFTTRTSQSSLTSFCQSSGPPVGRLVFSKYLVAVELQRLVLVNHAQIKWFSLVNYFTGKDGFTKVQPLLYLRNISINLPPFQQQHIWFLYSSFLQYSTAFSTAESCCSHLLCPSCCDDNQMVDTFCVQKFIEQENLIKENQISASKSCVWKHRSWYCEKSACKCWTEHGKFRVSSTVHSLFPCFCILIDKKNCYSFSIVHVSYTEAKKQSISFKYTLISTILNSKYFSRSHWVNKNSFTLQIQSSFQRL